MSRRLGNRRPQARIENQEGHTVRWEVPRLLEENLRRQWNYTHALGSHPGLYQDQKEQPVFREDAELADCRLHFPEDALDTLGRVGGKELRSWNKQSLWECRSVRFWLLQGGPSRVLASCSSVGTRRNETYMCYATQSHGNYLYWC